MIICNAMHYCSCFFITFNKIATIIRSEEMPGLRLRVCFRLDTRPAISAIHAAVRRIKILSEKLARRARRGR